MQIRKHKAAVLLFAALCFLSSCRKHIPHNVTRGFYYWKTIFHPTNYELNTLKRLQCRKLYLRLFDVDWNYNTKVAMPVAPIRLPQQMDTAFNYVPVIFITQRTLTNINDNAIAELANNIAAYATEICNQSGMQPKEIQVDCDWSAGTKNKYFALLKRLKQLPLLNGKTLSCTIRMHQVKYTDRNGIPPADKGLLMCYNMGDMKKPGNHNSILDVDIAEDYMKYMNTYPLPLDIALPLFDWCLQFHGQQMKGILRDVHEGDLKQNALFENTKENLYRSKADTLWHGYTIKAGDVLRIESPSVHDLEKIADFTDSRLKAPDLNVMFFDCDSITLNKYSTHDLEAVFDSYR